MSGFGKNHLRTGGSIVRRDNIICIKVVRHLWTSEAQPGPWFLHVLTVSTTSTEEYGSTNTQTKNTCRTSPGISWSPRPPSHPHRWNGCLSLYRVTACPSLSMKGKNSSHVTSRAWFTTRDQCIGALFGLENLLVLRPKTQISGALVPEALIHRRVLIPNGFPKRHGNHHVRIDIDALYLLSQSGEPLYHTVCYSQLDVGQS